MQGARIHIKLQQQYEAQLREHPKYRMQHGSHQDHPTVKPQHPPRTEKEESDFKRRRESVQSGLYEASCKERFFNGALWVLSFCYCYCFFLLKLFSLSIC